MIQRRLCRDDTLFQSGRPIGLNICFSFIFICTFRACAFHRFRLRSVLCELCANRRYFSAGANSRKFHSTDLHHLRAITLLTVPLFHSTPTPLRLEATTLVCLKFYAMKGHSISTLDWCPIFGNNARALLHNPSLIRGHLLGKHALPETAAGDL